MEECDTQLAVCHCVTVEGEQAVCHSLGPAERSQIHHICQSWVEPQISELESGRVICLCLFTHQPFLQCLMELVDFNDFMCFTFGGLLFGFVSSGWFSSHWVITVSLDQGLHCPSTGRLLVG